jgi:CzcA family heavy metal efflux pump
MNFSHWAASHRRSILFLVVILAIGGIIAGFKSSVSLFPHVNFPRVVVLIDAGDRPASQMMIAVTRPVEQAVRSVPGVANLRSTTSRGSAELSINFNWGEDMVSAMLQVESAVNQIVGSLPTGTNFSVRRMDPTVFPITAYSLTSKTLSLVQLRDIGEYQFVPLLSAVNGVAKVSVMGGEKAEYRIEIEPEKLAAYDLTFNDVATAVSASNILHAVGRMEDHYKLYLLLSDTRIRSLKNIEDTVIRSGSDGLVRLNDIAKVYSTIAPQWLRITADAQDAVLVQVYQQPGSNTVQIAKDVKAQLAQYENKLPKGVKIANWYDQSQLITESAKSVRDAIFIGVLLAALVLLLFLRSIKITLIAILIVPAVLAITVLLLKALNMSFNIMTLGGMAAAVGLIVDDAIVMIEHIIRRLRQHNKNIVLTIREAAIEFTQPLAGSSAATIIIFAPLAFLSGVTGAFFKALSLTMASSLAVSFLLSWLAVPLLSEHLLSQKDAEKEDNGRFFTSLLKSYQNLMRRLIPKPWLLIFILVPFISLGYIAYHKVGSGFMPSMDEGGFILDYRSAAGTSLSETDRLLRQVGKILQDNPSVSTYSRRTGAQLGGSLTEANEGDFFVRLTKFPRPPISQIMDDIRSEIEKNVPGLEVEMALLMEDLIGDLTAVPQPIEIKLYGDQVDELKQVAINVAEAIKKIKGVVDVKDGIVLSGDAINIIIDRDKASLEGINPDSVTQQLDVLFTGLVTTQVQKNIKLVDVRLWVPQSERSRISVLNNTWLRSDDGHRFPLRRIAHSEIVSGQSQITRDNLKRMIAVTGRISGSDLGSTIKQIKQVLEQKGLLKANIYYKLGGLYKQQQIAFNGLIVVFIAALALVFLLLLFLYEEFAAAIAIMLSPLLAMSAVFTGLWVTGIELNITAMMGMTMIIGIVTEVSIFYFSEYHDLLKQKTDATVALIQAGTNRFRPIAMTTLAAILALLPLALALGQGSAMQQPLAIAIISGLLVQIPLVLIVMPVVYNLMAKRH